MEGASVLDIYLGIITTITYPITYFLVTGFMRFLPKKRREAIDLQVILVVSLSLNYILKRAFQVPRPFVVDTSIVNRFTEVTRGYSFPSGHSQLISSFCTYYIMKYKNLSSWVWGILLITSVSASRVYFGLHYIRDVLCGVVLGIGVTYFYLRFRIEEDE